MSINRLNKGFTLIELLIVIAVIGILAALIFTAFKTVRDSARRTECMSNLKNIGLALIMYSDENYDVFPTDTVGVPNPAMMSLNLLYPDYISNRKIFNCHSDENSGTNTGSIAEGVAFTLGQCSYGYDRTHLHIADEISVAIAADRPPNNPAANPTDNSPNHEGKGQNVVYADGHAEFVETPTAGWTFPGGARDHIFLNAALADTNSDGGTDTSIIHDG